MNKKRDYDLYRNYIVEACCDFHTAKTEKQEEDAIRDIIAASKDFYEDRKAQKFETHLISNIFLALLIGIGVILMISGMNFIESVAGRTGYICAFMVASGAAIITSVVLTNSALDTINGIKEKKP